MNMRMSAVAAFALALGLILVNFTRQCHAALQVGYYKDKCMLKDVEGIVFSAVARRFDRDPTIAAALIRLHFHDCFVNSGGGRYSVETGRRDGFVSLASNVDLPSPSFSVSQSVDAFAKKGLDPTDMVLLLGGHTVGVAHCSLFQDRLYDFQNSGEPDPTMDLSLLRKLKSICPQNSPADRSVDLDQNPLSSLTVDNSFYKQIILKRGILQIDQELAFDPLTNGTVASIATSNDFPAKFGQAMVKLGAVDVLTGSQGEIRKSCGVTNSYPNFLHF
ncbi:hypothetical protein POUND7_009402 [Theobroma cacao]